MPVSRPAVEVRSRAQPFGRDSEFEIRQGNSHSVARQRAPGPVVVVVASAPYALPWNSSRPINMRRISLVPAPISYSLASRNRRPAGKSLI